MSYELPFEVEQSVNHAAGIAIWTVAAIIIAIIGGIVTYFLFVKDNKKVSNKFLAWLKGFLKFKTMLIEDLLKICYIVLALFITLVSFGMIASNFFGFLLTLVLGNVFLRVCFESLLIKIMIWKNTNEINSKMGK